MVQALEEQWYRDEADVTWLARALLDLRGDVNGLRFPYPDAWAAGHT